MDRPRQIVISEQRLLSESDREYVNNLNLNYDNSSADAIPPYLGLSADGWSSYYVGACWLKNGCCPLVVHPKVKDIDFIRIFADALNDDILPEYFKDAYRINFDAPRIQAEALNSVLSPLIVAHFLCVVNRLLKRGLKRDYVIREENLKSKVKGHVLALKNLQKNILRGHAELTLCRFQEYSLDYPENQIIKRALLASEGMLMSLKAANNELLNIVRKVLPHFECVSSDITPTEIRSIKKDKLHGEYPVAVNLAKDILRRTDYSIYEDAVSNSAVPEFALDMSRIFEFHVLSLLTRKYAGKKVYFQESAGIMGRCDFLIPAEQLIIDAKYKMDYINKSNEVKRADIREVAGYGRSESVISKLHIEGDRTPDCLIIYPSEASSEKSELGAGPILSTAEQVSGVRNFYMLGVPFPTVSK